MGCPLPTMGVTKDISCEQEFVVSQTPIPRKISKRCCKLLGRHADVKTTTCVECQKLTNSGANVAVVVKSEFKEPESQSRMISQEIGRSAGFSSKLEDQDQEENGPKVECKGNSNERPESIKVEPDTDITQFEDFGDASDDAAMDLEEETDAIQGFNSIENILV